MDSWTIDDVAKLGGRPKGYPRATLHQGEAEVHKAKPTDMFSALESLGGEEQSPHFSVLQESQKSERNPVLDTLTCGTAPEWCHNTHCDSFNMLVGSVIVMNAIVIGFETDLGDAHFVFFEHFFCLFFLLEMSAKLHQLGCQGYLSDPWNVFDCFLVVMGTLDLYVLSWLVKGKGGLVPLLRLLRMARVARILRLFKVFHELSVLLSAFVKAFESVMWISLLTLILDYVLAVFCTQMVGQKAHHYGENADKISMWFGGIGQSMRTLFIIMTLAQFDEIAVVLEQKYGLFLVWLVLGAYIIIAGYTMVALITGIICESLMSAQEEDKTHKAEEIRESREAFRKSLQDLLPKKSSKSAGKEGFLLKSAVLETFTEGKYAERARNRLSFLELEFGEDELREVIENLPTEKNMHDEEIISTRIFMKELEARKGNAQASHVWELKHNIRTLQNHQEELDSQLTRLSDEVNDLLRAIGAPP